MLMKMQTHTHTSKNQANKLQDTHDYADLAYAESPPEGTQPAGKRKKTTTEQQ